MPSSFNRLIGYLNSPFTSDGGFIGSTNNGLEAKVSLDFLTLKYANVFLVFWVVCIVCLVLQPPDLHLVETVSGFHKINMYLIHAIIM